MGHFQQNFHYLSTMGEYWASCCISTGSLLIKAVGVPLKVSSSTSYSVCFRVGTEELEGEQMGSDGVRDGKGRRRGHTMTRCHGLWQSLLPVSYCDKIPSQKNCNLQMHGPIPPVFHPPHWEIW